MENMGLENELRTFYSGKRVFLTGHTGFKGSWMCKILLDLGATVFGYSLTPTDNRNLYDILRLENAVESKIFDVRDLDCLQREMCDSRADIVFHMAAQPLVRESYADPVYTYETNVMGTVNLLESIRHSLSVKSVINITTDKVYENKEWIWGYRENEPLDGFEPYSNSKSCSELITRSYKRSFFNETNSPSVSTVRAGNVIGGGDFSKDRIIPDCVKAQIDRKKIIVRNPFSIRPYQHVLEPLFAYLLVAMRQYQDKKYEGSYNVGPDEADCVSTGKLVDAFCSAWGDGAEWESVELRGQPHESNYLKLDSTLLKNTFLWKPVWTITEAILATCEWSKCYIDHGDVNKITETQIHQYMKLL